MIWRKKWINSFQKIYIDIINTRYLIIFNRLLNTAYWSIKVWRIQKWCISFVLRTIGISRNNKKQLDGRGLSVLVWSTLLGAFIYLLESNVWKCRGIWIRAFPCFEYTRIILWRGCGFCTRQWKLCLPCIYPMWWYFILSIHINGSWWTSHCIYFHSIFSLCQWRENSRAIFTAKEVYQYNFVSINKRIYFFDSIFSPHFIWGAEFFIDIYLHLWYNYYTKNSAC